MENSAISWCHDTANLWIGCMKVHEGCDHCYAETLDNRWNGGHWGAHVNRKQVNSVWDNLKRFQKLAIQSGEKRRVFVGSMMDIFEKPYPLEDSKGNLLTGITTGDLRDRFFNDVVPNSPDLEFLLLTKRPSNIKKYVPKEWLTNPPVNVIYGASMVNQDTIMVDELLEVPGRYFISAEPLLGAMVIPRLKEIDWVIVGGESGHGARPMQPEWARSIRDQCKEQCVPFHFKQWGQFEPDAKDFMHHVKVKDHNAKLDGGEHKEFAK